MANYIEKRLSISPWQVWLSSFFYSLFQIAQGLVLHPYQTMQSLVREKIFIWMALLPMAFLIMLTLIWRYLVQILLLIFIPQIFKLTNFVVMIKFLGNWFIFFCLYWQLILGYLLVRFYSAWKK